MPSNGERLLGIRCLDCYFGIMAPTTLVNFGEVTFIQLSMGESKDDDFERTRIKCETLGGGGGELVG